MESINFIGFVKKIKQKVDDKKNAGRTSGVYSSTNIEASSLDALSDYGKAGINISAALSDSEYEKRLEDFKQKAKLQNLEISESVINKGNIALAEKLCFESKNGQYNMYSSDFIEKVLSVTDEKNVGFADSLIFGNSSDRASFVKDKYLIPEILTYVKDWNFEVIRGLYIGKKPDGLDLFPYKSFILTDVLPFLKEWNVDIVKQILFGKDKKGNDLFPQKNILISLLPNINEQNVGFAEKLLFGRDEKGNYLFPQKSLIQYILNSLNPWNIDFAEKLLLDKDEKGNDLFTQKKYINGILAATTQENLIFAESLCFGKDENGEDLFSQKGLIPEIIKYTKEWNADFAKRLCIGKNENGDDLFPQKDLIPEILKYSQEWNFELMQALCFASDSHGNDIIKDKRNISYILSCLDKNSADEIYRLINLCKQGELTQEGLLALIDKNNDILLKDYKKLESILGHQETLNLSYPEIILGCRFIDMAGKRDINEIDLQKKRLLIRNLVKLNVHLYNISGVLREKTPLIPSNQAEYCSLLKKLCKSIGIETEELSAGKVMAFNSALDDLSNILAALSDEEVDNLAITQKYPGADFIKNTFEILKDLKPNERQKVYNYFGFELIRNKHAVSAGENPKQTFSIIGYPSVLDDSSKLAGIKEADTMTAIEKLNTEAANFSQHNHISCNNPDIEGVINQLLDILPELRTQIGKKYSALNGEDSFIRSIKVMHEIIRNPQFSLLEETDKKLLLLASLFYTTGKIEGAEYSTSANESAFDTFYITKKLNLSEEESSKLYSLINNHKWFSYVNDDRITENEREERIKSVAYDLQYDNIFSSSKILAEADLKVAENGKSSFAVKQAAFISYSDKIKSYIDELKKSQPYLPVTKFPSASKINEAINTVNSDGSTNIKGIYNGAGGLVIIKFNEVENDDWEKIGFPKGAISKGITVNIQSPDESNSEYDINTGNIKFFVHGLDEQECLGNFDAFALPDSDALLSVSYAERPESKYKFFRTQGVILDVPACYVHGGGETDAGSGLKKTLDVFKRDYAFSSGIRHFDRIFVSDLIKNALQLSDSEYISFVNENNNKAIHEIVPEECREKLVKAFTAINSHERFGERSYNEMYVTNPAVMGVFAYSPDGEIKNVMNFVQKQDEFLKNYALEEDIPFVVFGD